MSFATSLDAWSKLQKGFCNKSRALVMSLKEILEHVTKGTLSGHDYLRSTQSIVGELALSFHAAHDHDPWPRCRCSQ